MKDLLARLEAATGPDRELDCLLDCLRWGWTFVRLTNKNEGSAGYIAKEDGTLIRPSDPPAYTASLDAALALVERVLPEWTWARALDGEMSINNGLSPPRYFARGTTPALALLTALLRALEAQKEGEK